MKADLPTNEEARLIELKKYEILDTLPEKAYDDITILAAHICDTPIALISLIDESRQWFKSKVGLTASETDRESAFCAHAIIDPNNVFIVPNATNDHRFLDNPLVTGEPYIRFYAGAPLQVDGCGLGTLCVIDTKPRELTEAQIEALCALSRFVVSQLDLRYTLKCMDEAMEENNRLKGELLKKVKAIKAAK